MPGEAQRDELRCVPVCRRFDEQGYRAKAVHGCVALAGASMIR